MRRRLFALAIALWVVATMAGISTAQNRSSSGGGTSTGGFGSTAGSSMGGGSASRGGTSTSGAFGGRTLGGGGGAATASRSFTGTKAGQGVDTSAGSVTGNERFVRGNRGAGDFVGGDSRDAANPFSSQSGGLSAQSAMSGLRTGQNGGNRGNNQGNNNQGMGGQFGNSRQQVKLRPTLKVEFEHRPPAPQKLTTELAQRFNRPTSRIRVATPLDVQMEGQTVVLRGAVATEHDRDLAERLALLEPGISTVRNELTVASPKASPAAAAATDLEPPTTTP